MKTILITGASSGLGKACVKLFSAKGWRVIATMRNPAAWQEQLANVEVLALDVTNVAQIQQTAANYTVDVVLNNAGYVLMGPLEAYTDEQLVQLINTNLLGTMRVTQAFLPYFRERGSGLFLNVTSTAAVSPDPFMSVYAGTKAAIHAWTEAMHSELSKVGVGIKTIIPGLMNTNLTANAQIALHPVYQRWIDSMMMFFSSPAAAQLADDPAHIALEIYAVATADNAKIHYFTGPYATNVSVALQQDGIEKLMAEKEQFFL
jgi:short-subunit dehydrogenase